MSTEEPSLVARASRGDVEAFSKLVRAHAALVRGVTLRMLGGQEAQDASQEVWVRVWANMKSFRGECAFSTWLYRVTVNTCLSFRHKESRRRRREVDEAKAHLFESSGADDDPEEAALDAERRGEIQVALGNVRAEHRAAMVMRHMEGLSCAEVSEALGVPDGTVKGWASRGRAAMLAALSQGSAERIIPHPHARRTAIPQSADDAAVPDLPAEPGSGRITPGG
ncbi:MAG: RNA polymerase sigma factor [Actinomycetota bacterium]|nr:RNA polymerase sigma factor [Actinomycetota bacterium]